MIKRLLRQLFCFLFCLFRTIAALKFLCYRRNGVSGWGWFSDPDGAEEKSDYSEQRGKCVSGGGVF